MPEDEVDLTEEEPVATEAPTPEPTPEEPTPGAHARAHPEPTPLPASCRAQPMTEMPDAARHRL